MKITQSLNNPETLNQVKAELERLRSAGFEPGASALELLYSLERQLRLEHLETKEMAREYRDILADLRIHLFPLFTPAKVINFVKHYFIRAVLKDSLGEVGFFGLLKSFFLQTNFFDRDKLITQIRKSLFENEEMIGTKPIVVNGKRLKPTFGNWLKDYVQVMGTGKQNITSISTYFIESANSQTLNREEKKLLNRALRYFEALKLNIKEIGSPGNYSLGTLGFSAEEVAKFNDDIFKIKLPEMAYHAEIKEVEKEVLKREARKQVAKIEFPKVKPRTTSLEELEKMKSPRVAYEKKEEAPKAVLKQEMRPKPVVAKPVERQVREVKKVEKVMPSAEEIEKKRIRDQFEKARLEKKRALRKEEIMKRKVISKQPEKLKELLKPEDLARVDVDFFRSLGKFDEERLKVFNLRIDELKKKTDPDSLRTGWQSSSLYKLYLEIGRKSMTSDLSVAEVSKALFSQGKPYLTEREFEMIAEISSKF